MDGDTDIALDIAPKHVPMLAFRSYHEIKSSHGIKISFDRTEVWRFSHTCDATWRARAGKPSQKFQASNFRFPHRCRSRDDLTSRYRSTTLVATRNVKSSRPRADKYVVSSFVPLRKS